MPKVNIIKVVANKEGRYPIRLFGTDYEIEPTDKVEEPKPKKSAPKKTETKPEVGQPETDNPEQDNNTTPENK